MLLEDFNNIYVGDNLIHQVFGVGRVSGVDKKYVKVLFSTGEKSFVYPSAFENGYLKKFNK